MVADSITDELSNCFGCFRLIVMDVSVERTIDGINILLELLLRQ